MVMVICQIAKKNAIFLTNMVMLICQIAKKKRYLFSEYGDAYMPNS